MTDEVGLSITAELADDDVEAWEPEEAAYIVVMTPSTTTYGDDSAVGSVEPEDVITTVISSQGEPVQVQVSKEYLEDAGETAFTYKPVAGTMKGKEVDLALEQVVAFDLETTGTETFDSKIVMGTFWVLNENKADMVTFADDDEEILAIEIADFLNQINPTTLVGFNLAFDMAFLGSRFIKYMIGCSPFYNASLYDLQQWAKKGTWKYLSSTMDSGSLEDWAIFLFGEQKAYTVEECLEAYEAGELTPFIIRNRQDVGFTGDFYKLIRYSEMESGYEAEPTELRGVAGTGGLVSGTVETQCPVCKQNNVYDYEKADNRCTVCGNILPDPASG